MFLLELQFGFETGAGLYTHEGDNLVISFEDGGKIILTDFYAQAKEELPEFLIEGDTKISSEQFLAQFNDETLLPAAGPAAGPTASASSGINSYADDAGNLIDGISRLGGLGNNQWSRSTELNDNVDPNGLATTLAAANIDTNLTTATTPTNPTDPTNPTAPTPTEPRMADANVRFVMLHDADSDPTNAWEMTGKVEGFNGFVEGSSFHLKYGTATVVDGKVTYTLNPDSIPENQETPRVDYIQYKDANDVTHSVQVVITTSPKFDDALKESGNYNDQPDVTLDIVYEVHSGTQSGGNYNTSSSEKDPAKSGESYDGNDYLTYNSLYNGTVNAGRGDDEITIESGIAYSIIEAGEGDNTVIVNGGINRSPIKDDDTDKSQDVITAGDGNDKITIAGGVDQGDIKAGAGENIIVVGGNIEAGGTGGGLNFSNVNTGEDKDIITVHGSLNFSDIDAGAGDNVIVVDKHLSGDDQNSSTITTLGGKDTITTGSLGSWSKINAGDGDNIVTVNGEVSTYSQINTGKDIDTITINGNVSGGSKVSSGAGDDIIKVLGDIEKGMDGDLKGGTIDAGKGNNTVYVAGNMSESSTISAMGLGSVNTVIVNGVASTNYDDLEKNTITVEGGMYADYRAENLIESSAGTIDLNLRIEADGEDSKNTINGGYSTVTINETNTDEAAFGMKASDSAANSITTTGDIGTVDIIVSSENNMATGIDTENASNKITAGGDVDIIANGAMGIGVYTKAGAENLPSTTSIETDGKLTIDADSSKFNVVAGIISETGEGNKLTIKARTELDAKEIIVNADGNDNAQMTFGVAAMGAGSFDPSSWGPADENTNNLVTLKADKIEIHAGKDAADLAVTSGDWSQLKGESLAVSATGFAGVEIATANLDVYAAGDSAYGIYNFANGGNPNKTNGGNTKGKGYELGVHITGTEADNTFNVTAHSNDGLAMGVTSTDVGSATISGNGGNDTLNILAHAHGDSTESRALGLQGWRIRNQRPCSWCWVIIWWLLY